MWFRGPPGAPRARPEPVGLPAPAQLCVYGPALCWELLCISVFAIYSLRNARRPLNMWTVWLHGVARSFRRTALATPRLGEKEAMNYATVMPLESVLLRPTGRCFIWLVVPKDH